MRGPRLLSPSLLVVSAVLPLPARADDSVVADATGASDEAAPAARVYRPPATAAEFREEAEAVVFLVQYIGGDYANAVDGGRVVNDAEYAEISGFAEEAVRRTEALLAAEAAGTGASKRTSTPGAALTVELERLQAAVARKAAVSEVRAVADGILRAVMERFRVVSFPRRAPDRANAGRLFAANCVVCHGATGAGDGPNAKDLNPKPAPFADPEFLDGLTPFQAYNAVTQGIPGTGMAGFRGVLGDDARWDLAYFLWTFDPRGTPPPPPSGLELPVREQVIRSNRQLAEDFAAGRWGVRAGTSDEAQGWARAVRARPLPEIAPADRILLVQEAVERAWIAVRPPAGRAPDRAAWAAAADRLTNIYLDDFEPLESHLETRDRAARTEVESAFGAMRAALRGGDGPGAERSAGDLLAALDGARASLAAPPEGGTAAAMQSGAIILREGVEAALLVGLILAALKRANRAGLRRYVAAGVVGALAAGGATWAVSEIVLGGRFWGREALEGVVSLVAAAVLVGVTFWLIRRADMDWWMGHLKTHVGEGLERGRGWVLAGVAFLAVYREAFETVLFYQALLLQSPGSGGAVLGGFVLGLAALLVGIAVALKFGVKVPFKVFFTGTSVLLVALAFTFIGDGIHALQVAGVFPMTLTRDWVGSGWLGVYPTVETWAAQGALAALFAAGAVLRWRRAAPVAAAAERGAINGRGVADCRLQNADCK